MISQAADDRIAEIGSDISRIVRRAAERNLRGFPVGLRSDLRPTDHPQCST